MFKLGINGLRTAAASIVLLFSVSGLFGCHAGGGQETGANGQGLPPAQTQSDNGGSKDSDFGPDDPQPEDQQDSGRSSSKKSGSKHRSGGKRHHGGKKRGGSRKGSKKAEKERQDAEKAAEAAEAMGSNAPKSSKGTINLATWNVENFFDTVDDSYKDEVLTPSEYAEKLSRVSGVIQTVRADIIGLEEIETEETVIELGERCGYPYHVFVPGNDRIRGINVAVLSKVPVGSVVSHARDRFRAGSSNTAFSRDCLEVHFKHNSRFTLLVNHFKSKIGGETSDAKRKAQAQRVSEIAGDLKSFPVAICGDLNDTPDSKPLQPLTGCTFLTDVLGHLPENQRLSFFNRRYQSALDYIFVNDKLKPAVVPGTAKVFTEIPDIDKASDHRPVRVTLDLNKI